MNSDGAWCVLIRARVRADEGQEPLILWRVAVAIAAWIVPMCLIDSRFPIVPVNSQAKPA